MTHINCYYLVCMQRTRLSQAEQDILGRMEPKMEEDNEVVMSHISVGQEE